LDVYFVTEVIKSLRECGKGVGLHVVSLYLVCVKLYVYAHQS